MNREIKFRGKCSPQSKYKGEWVTGNLVIPEQIQDNEVLIVVAHSDSCKSTYHVDKNTTGQYTGQQDINGKDIYEGDIFEVLNTSGMYAVVEWNSVINAMCIRFKDKSNYEGQVSDALVQLKTFKRIKENFSEALPYLNFSDSTTLAPQFEKLRALLNN